MLYFKNKELAQTYHISLRTVLNWIEAAKQGKLDLTLHTQGDKKSYIANTAKNIVRIEQLVEQGKKYRNTRGHKVITPLPEFYEVYDQQQRLDIVTNIDIHREIPLQYIYIGKGAHNWDEYTRRLAEENTANTITSARQLLAVDRSYFDDLLSCYGRVNIVDVGVGNALPLKNFLGYLLEKGTLGHYFGIDISTEMLKIAESNIKQWYDDKIIFEGFEYDITYDRFPNLLAGEHIMANPDNVLNLVLVLGGTLTNLRSPDAALKVIHDSMGRNDLLIYIRKVDNETSRKYFDFNQKSSNADLPALNRFIINLLNIDDSLYEVEMGFDEQRHERYIRIRLKVSLSIKFEFDVGSHQIELNKDDTILLWRSRHQSPMEILQQFEQNEFTPIHTSQTPDETYMLTVAKIKRGT